MILVDTSVGSNPLVNAPPLRALGAQLCKLASGDVTFIGVGETGPVSVGVEVKSVGDVLSSLVNGRLNGVDGQLACMVDAYDVRWLVYYGLTRPNPTTGVLQVAQTWAQKGNPSQLTLKWNDYGGDGAGNAKTSRRKALTYDYLEKFFVSPAFTALDVRVKHCYDVDEVAVWIAALYTTWQKPWGEHRCLHTFDQSRRQLIESPPTFKPATKRERQVAVTAFSLPGLGYERAWALAAKYGANGGGGVRAMVNASASELAEVRVVGSDGRERRIGKVVAQAVEEAVT